MMVSQVSRCVSEPSDFQIQLVCVESRLLRSLQICHAFDSVCRSVHISVYGAALCIGHADSCQSKVLCINLVRVSSLVGCVISPSYSCLTLNDCGQRCIVSKKNKKLWAAAWLAACATWAGAARADELQEETWNAKFQTTYIWQTKPSFNAAYSGQNSLKTGHEKAYSFSATAALGWRPWNGTELYLDPEILQGVPLSNLTGLAGLTNAEQQKSSGPNPVLYRARLFLRQTWNLGQTLGGEQKSVKSDVNQLASTVDARRLVVTVGNLSVPDLFDDNSYAHDPRSQFMNTALAANGAYDYASDARGYTWGAAAEYFYDDWTLRAGRFRQPLESNGLPLDAHIFKHFGDQIELEHAHTV